MTKKYIQNCTGDHCDRESHETKKSSLPKNFSRIIFYILLVGFLGVSGYVILFSSYLKISHLEIRGTQELDKLELEQKINDSLAGKFLGVVPRNNYLFVSHSGIEKLLEGDFKKIRAVRVTKTFPSDVIIQIEERKALLVWCLHEKCFLLDENGIAYGEADFNSPELQQNHLLRVIEKGGRAINIGEKVIEPSYEQYVLSAKDALGKFGFQVLEEYSTPSRMAEEINVKTAQGPEFLFSTQFSLESALRNLTVIFQKEIPEEKRNEISYMDLRNESKIFYKFRGVESENLEGEKVEEQK